MRIGTRVLTGWTMVLIAACGNTPTPPEGEPAQQVPDGVSDEVPNGVPAWWGSAQDGLREAEDDIAAGRVVIRRFGRPWGAASIAQGILKTRYGIELEFTGSVLVRDRLYQDQRYNERMEREIRERFGRDIVEGAFAEAERIEAQQRAWQIRLSSLAVSREAR